MRLTTPLGVPAREGLSVIVSSSPALIVVAVQPASRSTVGLFISPTQCTISPCAFLTSNSTNECGFRKVNPVTMPVSVTVFPRGINVKVRRTAQFTATVQNTTTTAVVWKVNGITGGNATLGTISASGLYRAPSAVPNPNVVTVSATSVADSTQSALGYVLVSK